jgi:polyphenol oxidase
MRNPFNLKKIRIKLCAGTRRYGFQGYQSQNFVLGSFDAYDQNHQALNFSDRDLYLPLRDHFPDLSFASLDQCHGKTVRDVMETKSIFENLGEGDGLVTSINNQALTVRTADCIPLFAISKDKVGIAHAGYKGVLRGVLGEFQTLLESSNQNLYLAMGPHIESCCFQVGEEVASAFLELELLKEHDIIRRQSGTYLSLSKIVKFWFENSKEKVEFMEGLSRCSCCHKEYHSYRRDKSNDRMGHLIFKTA